VPGYDYGLRVTPTEAGEFLIICNEFCGINHHNMLGKMIVVDPDAEPVDLATNLEASDE
jgi:heme/copper-type cytochrome/quinol oxidase subunit 2